MADLRDETYRTPDGAEIAYRVRSGRNAWVLLHGLGCDASMWDGVVRALAPETGVLVPELRGHGASTLGWELPSIDRWALDVEEIVARERIERPAVAGLSMGGYTALAIAASFPGLARAFAFVSTTAAPDDDPGRQRRAGGLTTLRRGGWRALADGLVPSLLAEERLDFPENRSRILAMFERAGDAGLAAALFALANRKDRRLLLPTISVPSVAVVGSLDRLTPPDRAREIATGIPGAHLVEILGVAHMSAMEAPAEVARALAALRPPSGVGGADVRRQDPGRSEG